MDTQTIAERAKRYQRLCEAYLSLHDAHVDLDTKHTTMQQQFADLIQEHRHFKTIAHSQQMALAERLEVAESRVSDLRNQIATQQAIIEQQLADFDTLSRSRALAEQAQTAALARANELEAANSVLGQDLESLRLQVARLAVIEAENVSLKRTLAERDAEIVALRAELAAKAEVVQALQQQNDWFGVHFDGEVLHKLQESEDMLALIGEVDQEPLPSEYEAAAAIIAAYLEEIRQISSFPVRQFEVEAA